MKHYLFLALFIFGFGISHAQTPMPIADAKVLPANSVVTIKGIVLNGDEFGNVRYVYDGTAGIAVFNAALADDVTQGDSLQVTGTLSNYFNLIEIVQGTGFSYTVISSNNALPEPIALPASVGFAEAFEGQLVRFENVQFSAGGNFVALTNYDINTDNGVQEVRINANTDLAGTPIPGEYINLVGIMSQYNAIYQLLPRSLSDIEFIGSPPVFSSSLQQSNMTTSSFLVSFSTLYPGTTQIQYGLTPDLELPPIVNTNFVTWHDMTLTDLQAGSIYYVQARSVSPTGYVSQSSIQTMATTSNSSGDIKVYFNHDVYAAAATGVTAQYLNNAVDDTLLAYISRAQYTLDFCMYSIDNQNDVITALNTAAASGVQVRVVADSGISDVIWNQLNIADKERRPASLNGIMHNKFMVIDANSSNPNDPIVWTGSTNFTSDQLLKDPNNVIIFQDQSLAKAYQIEFEEMLAGNFSTDKTDNTPKEFTIGGRRVECYFSPTDLVNPAIQRTIQSAEYDLYFALLSFTRTDIAYRISDAYDDDVFIIGILDDASEPNAAIVYDILEPELGDQLLIDNNNYIFHHKYLLADPNLSSSDPTVLTGSHNWSSSAQFRNDENTVIVHDAAIANLFYQEFVQRYGNLGGTQLVNSGMVGINSNPLQTVAVNVYPNPATRTLQISYNAQQIGSTLLVQISDISGKIVFNQQYPTVQDHAFAINLDNLTSGMYLLNINGTVKKIVIEQ